MRKHGVAVFGQARATARRVPRSTQADPTPLHDYKRVSKRPPHTPEHNSAWKYSYTNTLPPTLTLPAALHNATHHLLYWIGTAKPMVPKKAQKCGNTGSPCLDKPVFGQRRRGGGGGFKGACASVARQTHIGRISGQGANRHNDCPNTAGLEHPD